MQISGQKRKWLFPIGIFNVTHTKNMYFVKFSDRKHFSFCNLFYM